MCGGVFFLLLLPAVGQCSSLGWEGEMLLHSSDVPCSVGERLWASTGMDSGSCRSGPIGPDRARQRQRTLRVFCLFWKTSPQRVCTGDVDRNLQRLSA